jgi:hypothetical protein
VSKPPVSPKGVAEVHRSTERSYSRRNSGNSRCGHNYGTSFSAADKKALLEYLKSL